jgi:metallo-beta-lactamase family protein
MKITFLGATQYVTGSCHLLQASGKKILLDCGLIQGNHDSDERNKEAFEFDIKSIDAVILSHAHLDHSGRLPLLVKQGYTGPIYTHSATIDLCKILLEDAGYLNERGVVWENRKRERKGLELISPLYTQEEARLTQQHFKNIEYNTVTEIFPGISLTLNDAGHILGSAIVELDLKENSDKRKIVYSGDLGHSGAPILKNPAQLHHADLVIMESTYGDRLHRDWKSTWQELGEVIQCAKNNKGNILIPAFTVGRTQELLYVLGKHFDEWGLENWEIFLDSPMAIDTTKVYSKYSDIYNKHAQIRFEKCGNPFDLPNLHLTPSTADSMTLNKVRSGAIIIAGSGMCTGGRIKQHLKHNLWRKHCHLIFVGFQARGTPGRALIDGTEHLQLWGERIQVKAKIHTIGGFSAHADQEGLMQWYQQFNNHPQLVLVHGEEEAQKILADKFNSDLNIQVKIAKHGDSINLNDL